jgi:hypothetical protein
MVLFFSSTVLFAQADMKRDLAGRIVDDLLSLWSKADIPGKYSFLIWPAYKELLKETIWPRLEFIRDIPPWVTCSKSGLPGRPSCRQCTRISRRGSSGSISTWHKPGRKRRREQVLFAPQAGNRAVGDRPVIQPFYAKTFRSPGTFLTTHATPRLTAKAAAAASSALKRGYTVKGRSSMQTATRIGAWNT